MAIKRTWDIVLSLIGLFVLSPVFLVTAICIKAEDDQITKTGLSIRKASKAL